MFDVVSKIYIATDSSPVDMQSYELCCDMIDVVIDVSCIYGSVEGSSPYSLLTVHLCSPLPRLRDDSDGTAYDQHSSSIIRLNNGTILYLREVNRFLALVCLLREDVFERQGLIEYNFHCFREAIQEVHPTLALHYHFNVYVCVCVQVFDIRRKAILAPNSSATARESP